MANHARYDLTWSAVDGTITNPPSGYVVDHTRTKLGLGEKVFAAGKRPWNPWQQVRFG